MTSDATTLTDIELHYLRSAAKDWYDMAVWDWDEDEKVRFTEYVVAQDCMDQHLPSVFRVFKETVRGEVAYEQGRPTDPRPDPRLHPEYWTE